MKWGGVAFLPALAFCFLDASWLGRVAWDRASFDVMRWGCAGQQLAFGRPLAPARQDRDLSGTDEPIAESADPDPARHGGMHVRADRGDPVSPGCSNWSH